MPGNGAYTFNEPSDYEASVDEAKIELVVTVGGPFKAALTRAELGELHLLRSQEDQASIAYVGLPADLVFVAFPTRFNPPPMWGGQELRSGDIVFYGLGEHVHQRTAGSSEKGFIALKPERLAFWSRTLTEAEVAPPTFVRIIRPSRATMSRLRYLHASACGLVEKSPTTIAHPEVARAIEQELIHALITCLRPEAPLETRPIRSRRAALMNRFEGVLTAHPDQPLHIPELCSAIGVSEGTLRACCAEFLGITIGRYLRLRRLRLARTALRYPDSATTSVAGVARRYGFGELGRFAGMYRAVYGEAPSATLRLRRHQGPQE
jgi:AraC-like DNA-binding protein